MTERSARLRSAGRRGYSILEVVIVLGLIAILATIGWFGYQALTDSTRAGTVEATAQALDREVRSLGGTDLSTPNVAMIQGHLTSAAGDVPAGTTVTVDADAACALLVHDNGNAVIDYTTVVGSFPQTPGVISATTETAVADACE